MSRARWGRFETLCAQFAIRPILAVVPENRDPDLVFDPADPEFWQRVLAHEETGATIALHGFGHAGNRTVRGLVPLHRHSEFAGVEAALQRAWIHNGLEILRDHGLHPRLWAAPRHGFDRNTLKALRDEGIRYLSDGFTSHPIGRGEVGWIPQQLWEPAEKKAGLWTICIHSNTADDEVLRRLRAFLESRSEQFTSFDRVITDYSFSKPGFRDCIREQLALGRILVSRRLDRLRRLRRERSVH
jgi:Uncharacterized protein conserved in bacteria (DUF2334)